MKISMPYFHKFDLKWREIEGELVDVAPHLVATFIVHRCQNLGGWHVSCVESGYGLVDRTWAETRKESIRLARTFLSTIDQQTMDRQLEKCKRAGFKGQITPHTSPAQGDVVPNN